MRAPSRGLPGATVLAASLALGLAVTAPPSSAQQEASLDRVDALVSDGRTDEARRVLERWWRDEGRTGVPRVEEQRSLWLRALLTPEPERAALDYQRLVVEYPGGPYSDEALLRLAQAAHASGDLPTAAERFRSILRDYPESPASLQARQWMGRYGSAAATVAARDGPGRPAAGRARDTVGAARVPAARDPASPVSRDSGSPASRDTGSPDSRDPGSIPIDAGDETREDALTASVEGGNFSVQAGAFATPRRARDLLRRLQDAGYEGRVVVTPADRLLRVRVGRLPTRSDATGLVQRLREAGFDAHVVDDVDREGEPGSR